MSGRRIRNKIACLLLIALILGQAVYTSAFPFDNPIIDSIENLFGAIRYDVTIAELVISLLTGAGATPVNSAMAQALESELGTATYQVGAMYEEGLFSITEGVFQDNGFIDAIEDTAAWATYNLGNIFETTSEDVDAGIATIAGGGALNLGRALVGAIDTGFIIEMGATGGLLAGAAIGGFGLAYLIDHIVTEWGNNINKGIALEAIKEFNDAIANGDAGYVWSEFLSDANQTRHGMMIVDGDAACFRNGEVVYTGCRTASTLTRSNWIEFSNGSLTTPSKTIYTQNGSTVSNYNCGTQNISLPDNPAASTLASQYANGSNPYQNVVSPDFLGRAGNMPHSYETDSEGNTVPVIHDIVSPLENGQGLKPINWNDYKDLVDEANQNYTNDPTNQEDQIQIWDDFKDPYIEDIQDTPENPDNPDIPDNPDADYVPDFDEDITPDTVIDDVVLDDIIDDVVPDQPDIPDKPDLTPGEIEENLDVSVSGDITDIFPFCIPFDVIALFEKFGDIDREPPHFHFTLDFGEWGQYDVDIDLEEWDNVATLCRTLELVIFILGLILITRELIRG